MHLLAAISVLFVVQALLYWTEQGLCSENDPPDIHFTKEPSSQVDFSNNTGTSVECKAGGSTPTTITWIFLDGTPVPNIQGLRKVTPDGTLIFSPFNSQAFRQDVHAVVYKCMATNIAGTLVSRDVKVKAVMDVDYDSNIYDVFAIRGNPAVIKCHVPSFLQDYVNVVAYIKDDSLKIASTPDTETKYTLASHGALYIKDVGSMDAGTNYKCQTYHRLTGKMRTSSSSGKLFVTDPHGNIPPRIVDSVTMLQVNVGETSLLPCVANGYPLPKASWFTKHGGQLLSLKNENRVRISAHGLIISNVQLADAGTYVCQVNSTVGNDLSEMTLIVNEQLKVSINPVMQRVNIGDPFLLKCVVKGHPVQSISWIKNGEPINPQRVQKNDDNSAQVNAITLEDKGIYQCMVQNDKESAQGAAQVLLGEFDPVFHELFKEETMQPGSPVAFTCIAIGNPNPTINWFLDTMPVKSSHKILIENKVTADGQVVSTLNIRATSPEDGGVYTCEASNKMGRQVHSSRLNVYGPLTARQINPIKIVTGRRVHLNCPVYGYPLDSVIWEKDSIKLPMDIRQVLLSNWTLVIDDVQRKEDSGQYKCKASNKGGQKTTGHIDVSVLVGPKIDKLSFQDKQVQEGVNVGITCVLLEGDPPISFNWMKDGQLASSLSGVHVVTPNEFSSLLTIAETNLAHSGNYTCTASNPVASATHTAQLKVNVPPKIVPFSFQSNELVEGMFVRVSCVVSRGDLPLSITWNKDGQPIQSDLGIIIRPVDEYSSDLSIDSVTLRHSGNYTCLVSNAAATTTYSAQLNVYVPPHWVKAPESDISVVQGHKIQLDCEASGFPKPIISWLIKEGSSPFSPMKTLATGNGRTVFTNGTLVIEKADASHENSYFCKASNGIGKGLSRITELKVLVPPKITNMADKKVVTSGQRISLQCAVDGERPINTTWLINGKQLLAKKYAIKNHENVSIFITELAINKVSQADDAVFTCQIENKYGKDEANISVTVQGPPDAPQGVKAISKGDKTVELSWVPPFDGHSPITKYLIEYKTTQGLPQNHTSSSANTQVLFHDLQSSSTYKFTVYAENEIGRSEMGGSTEITLAGEAPTGEPQSISVKAQNGKSIRVSWEPPPRDSWNGNILGYHVGFREANSDDPYEYRMLEIPEGYDKGLSFTLSDLKEFTSYNIVVQSFNDYGKGPLSQEVLSMTSEGVPSKAPLAVDCSPTSSQTISVHWQSPPQAFVHGILRGYRILYWTSHSSDGETKLVIQNTTETKVSLRGLAKFSNYSIQVLAYTNAGDGVTSEPVFCRTLEDVPSAPQDIKALPSSMDSVIVSWTLPGSPNGIITHYTVYVEDVASKQNKETRYVLQRNTTMYEVRNLKKNLKYGVRVSATTSIGEGPSTQLVEVAISGNTAPARIAAFGEVIKQQINKPVILSCPAVGMPTPRRTWLFRGQPVSTNSRIAIHPDGSLQIKLIYLSDNGNYTCHVVNDLGQEQISYLIIVKVAPTAPTLVVTTTTDTTVEIQWKPPTDGNSPVLGYSLSYKQDFATTWQKVDLQPYLSNYKISSLQCGTTYQAHLVAINEVGIGQPSDTITITTTGGVPSIPTMDQLIEVSSAHAILHLDSWSANGCPILYFVVEYKPQNARSWILVSNNLRLEKPSLILENLEPNTRYSLRMTAHTSAGSVIAENDFSTSSLSEDPMSDDDGRMGTGGLLSFLSIKVVVPTIICGLVILLCLVATCFWVSRKKSRHNTAGKKVIKKRGKGHPVAKRNNGSHIQIGNEDSDDEISPYAMVKLSDFQHNQIRPSDPRPSSSGFSGTPGRPVISHNYNPTAPPMSESYSPHPRGIIQPEHGRKYPILQGQPLYAMPNKKEVLKPLREASSERNDEFPAPPNEEETIFVFPPPPDDQDGEYDPPPPVIDWLPARK